MIDTHCHLLHGVDDGPRSAIESFLLARELAAAGVTGVVCTPHWSRRYSPTQAALEVATDEVRSAIDEARLRLDVEVAAEVSAPIALEAPHEELRTRALERFLFVEVDPDTPYLTLEATRSRLDEASLAPVFVHPERCRAVQRDPAVVDALRGQGALVQVVARSFASPSAAATTGWKLIDAGHVDVLGSDAHRPRHVSLFVSVLEEVGRRYGEPVAQGLVRGLAFGVPARRSAATSE